MRERERERESEYVMAAEGTPPLYLVLDEPYSSILAVLLSVKQNDT